jgi:hypothetical protein
LTNLTAYFDLQPDIVQSVLEWPNGTFLAPSDGVFAKNAPENEAFAIPLNIIDANDPSIAALFKYHTLAPFVQAADFGMARTLFRLPSLTLRSRICPVDRQWWGMECKASRPASRPACRAFQPLSFL